MDIRKSIGSIEKGTVQYRKEPSIHPSEHVKGYDETTD